MWLGMYYGPAHMQNPTSIGISNSIGAKFTLNKRVTQFPCLGWWEFVSCTQTQAALMWLNSHLIWRRVTEDNFCLKEKANRLPGRRQSSWLTSVKGFKTRTGSLSPPLSAPLPKPIPVRNLFVYTFQNSFIREDLRYLASMVGRAGKQPKVQQTSNPYLQYVIRAMSKSIPFGTEPVHTAPPRGYRQAHFL